MSNRPETGFEKATRATIELDIKTAYLGGDMNLVNQKLDIWPAGFERNPLANVAMRAAFPRLARFFPDAPHPGDTEEIEIVTPEMVERYKGEV